jgi:hypothetical protein|tara:strand:- start:1124 stop:1375 length:252 start_codon:yes stop_codon:yes gene_type:complete
MTKAKEINEKLYNAVHANNKQHPQELFQDLLRLKDEIQKCIEAKICSWCSDNVKNLRDKKSKIEYQISGLCQDCQDETFREVN